MPGSLVMPGGNLAIAFVTAGIPSKVLQSADIGGRIILKISAIQ